VLLEELTRVLSKEKDSEAVYRCLVALGTLVKELDTEIKAAAKEVYDFGAISRTILSSGLGKEPRIKSILGEITESLPA
jgi:phospholipase A-2-activating protein